MAILVGTFGKNISGNINGNTKKSDGHLEKLLNLSQNWWFNDIDRDSHSLWENISQMGLFFEVLSAINNPKQDASIQQLGDITQSIQSLAQQNDMQPDAMQSLLSNLGPMMGPLLKQQLGGGSGGGTGNMLGNLVGMVTGKGEGLGAIASVMTPQMMQTLGQSAGISGSSVQSLLPTLLPIVMKVLNLGNSSSGGMGGNPILNAFLDEGAEGADLGQMLKFANRFMNPPQT